MNYTINRSLLEKYLIGFRKVLSAEGDPFSLTAANHVYAEQEMYKYHIAETAEKLLHRAEWKHEEVGSGSIFAHVKNVMDAAGNLVYVTNRLRFYDKCAADLPRAEEALYKLYRGGNDEDAFSKMTNVFGKVYDVIGYLYFIHDSKRYLPISPGNFDKRFEAIGIDYRMSFQCSWENYKGFIRIVRDIRDIMQDYYEIDGVSLLDAHSFLWMFWKIDKYYETAEPDPYLVPVIGGETQTIVTARIGQSQYRKNLLQFWDGKCSVTGCSEEHLLKASHIKPWRDSTPEEKGDIYNGLLLIPNLDAAFDGGYISFDDDGKIMISARLTAEGCLKLGISKEMKLRKVTDKHRQYLAYHRSLIFISSTD